MAISNLRGKESDRPAAREDHRPRQSGRLLGPCIVRRLASGMGDVEHSLAPSVRMLSPGR
jgi:hypothetical protein